MWPYNDNNREVVKRLARIERTLDNITAMEIHNMSAIDDLKAELQGVADEADGITAGIAALEAGQNSGSQAAVDAAVADIKTAADNMKAHVDAAAAALTAVPTPPVTPPSP